MERKRSWKETAPTYPFNAPPTLTTAARPQPSLSLTERAFTVYSEQPAATNSTEAPVIAAGKNDEDDVVVIGGTDANRRVSLLGLKKTKLQDILKDHGLAVSGNKEDLVQRFLLHEYKSNKPPQTIIVHGGSSTRRSTVSSSVAPAPTATTTTTTTTAAAATAITTATATTTAVVTTAAATENHHAPSTFKNNASTNGSGAVDKLTATTLPRPRKIPLSSLNVNNF